jgi:hypothetical protein
LKENGTEKFAVLTIADYAAVREALEDAEDARILEEAIRRDAGGPRIPFAEVKRQLAAQRRATSKKRPMKNAPRKAPLVSRPA